MNISIFFFFQAEDGIRDIGVTGIQTCALPICRLLRNYRFLSYCSTIFLTISPPTDPHSLEVKLPLYSVKFTPNSFAVSILKLYNPCLASGTKVLAILNSSLYPYQSYIRILV